MDVKKIALLIDAENISHGMMDDLFEKIKLIEGKLLIRKAFGNWSKDSLKDKNWIDVLQKYAISPHHIFDFTKQKNAADIQLVIYALKLVYTNDIDTFILVTSDSDFTPLVYELRANNKNIIGYGSKSYSESFKNSCDDFNVLELKNTKKIKEKKLISDKNTIVEEKSIPNKSNLLKKIWNENKKEKIGGWLSLDFVIKSIKILDPNFKLKELGFSKFDDYVTSNNLFEIKKTKINETTKTYIKYKNKKIEKNEQIDLNEIWDISLKLRENGWLSFDNANLLGKELSEQFSMKNYGYKSFKSYVQEYENFEIKIVNKEKHNECYLRLNS